MFVLPETEGKVSYSLQGLWPSLLTPLQPSTPSSDSSESRHWLSLDSPSASSLPMLLGRCTTSYSASGHPDSPGKFRPPPGLPPPEPWFVHANSLPARPVTSDPGPPPGLSASRPASETTTADNCESLAPLVSFESSAVGASCLEVKQHGQSACTLTWRVDGLLSKLRASRGFPLLSPAFALAGLPSVRVMFAPGSEWLEFAGTATSRRQKARRTRTMGAQEGAAFGEVKVKVGGVEASGSGGGVVDFEVFLGASSCAATPSMRCDFSQESVRSQELRMDWRKHVDGGCLTFRLEFRWVASAGTCF